jgi:hypothetical protein
VELRELLDGRLVVFYQNSLLAAQPAPASPFVLTPRSDPGRDRQRVPPAQRARRQQLQAAVGALTRTLRARRPTPASAVEPSAPASGRSRPRHPWRTTFSPRQRRLNAAKRG